MTSLLSSLSLSQKQLSLKKLYDFDSGEVLNIDKPKDWSSFDVVKKIRGRLRLRKVGHAGTLDPFATGVLLVCTGAATKRAEELMKLKKEYLACVELGKITDTFDVTGRILNEQPVVPSFSPKTIDEVCSNFVGAIFQQPPMYSAVKVQGKRLYKLARQGITIKREPRKVTVHNLDVIEYKKDCITLKVVCSKGTYIRALANDIGEMLGVGGYLKELRRTKIGHYQVENALGVNEFIRVAMNQ